MQRLAILCLFVFLAQFFFRFSAEALSEVKQAPDLLQIFQFISFMFVSRLNAYLGNVLEFITGALFVVSTCLLTVFNIYMFRKEKSKQESIYFSAAILFSYALLFAILAAYGRYSTDKTYAFTSRYSVYTLTAYLGVFFCIFLLKQRRMQFLLCAGMVFLLGYTEIQYEHAQTENMNYYAVKKREWITCYSHYKDIRTCNDMTDFFIAPSDVQKDYDKLLHALNYIEANKLNFFSEHK